MQSEYAIYLRKSRADYEAEQRGEGETLARHRRALTELAIMRGYNVTALYEEIVSGDTIASRPEMQKLLVEVESGKYAGVIVNDADRLARGDSIDQGIVKQAFYATGTLIITPIKTYDPANEADEDFFDFSMFMARFEYRKITHRMQTGRTRSASEGNWIGTRVNFGYVRVPRTDRKGYTLTPDPENAKYVKMSYDWYAYGDTDGSVMSSHAIAKRLKQLGVKTQFGNDFTPEGVRRMLQDPAYIGRMTWAKKIKRVVVKNGVRKTIRVNNDAPIVVENAFPALVDLETWNIVQHKFATHKPLPKNTLAPCKNVLAGLVVCSECGMHLQRKPGTGGRPDMIKCLTAGCPTTGIYIPIVEDAILDVLREWQQTYLHEVKRESAADPRITAAEALRRQIDSLNKQLDKMYDLVEQGVYTPVVFVKRSEDVKSRIRDAENSLADIVNKPSKGDIIRAQLPRIQYVIEAYPVTDDELERNQMLKSVISKVVYKKTKQCTRADNPADYMELEIFPVVPI